MSETSFQIVNARILTMEEGMPFLEGGVTVQDGRLTEVGEVHPIPGLPRLDFHGDLLIPGLIQCHVHLCQTLFRNQAEGLPLLRWLRERIWPLEAALDEDTLKVSVQLGVAELLRGGTTCLLDMGTVRHQDVLAETLREAGIRAAMGKAMMDAGEGVPPALLEKTDASLQESLRLARRWHGAEQDRLRYAFAPRFVLSCSRELQVQLAEVAAREGYLIHTHASEHPQEVELIQKRFGMSNVQLLHQLGLCNSRSILAHAVHLSQSDRQLLASTQTRVCHCPSSNLKLGSGVADVGALLRAGIPVGLGADGAPCNNSLDAFQEMRLAYLLASLKNGPGSLSPRQVMEMVTREAARILHWEERVGSIRAGKEADLVRLRADFRLGFPEEGWPPDPWAPLVAAGHRDLVRDVWVAGRRLVRNGKLQRLDEEALQRQAPAALKRVLDKAGL